MPARSPFLIASFTATFVTLPWAATRAAGELAPRECVVIYNPAFDGSLDIARYYMRVRDIPDDHLLGMALPRTESMARGRFDKDVRPGVRAFLAEHDWGDDVRCLIPCHGVPLRVLGVELDEDGRRRVEALERSLAQTVDALEALIEKIRRAHRAPDDPSPAPVRSAEAPADRRITQEALQKLLQDYQTESERLVGRLRGVSGEQDRAMAERVLGYIHRAEGIRGLLLRAERNQSWLGANALPRLRMAGEAAGEQADRIKRLTAYGSTADEFDSALPLTQNVFGLFGLVKTLRERIRVLRGERSEAAFDSELAMVLIDKYPLSEWQPNGLYAYEPGPMDAFPGRTLMVARVDGPTTEIVRRMIDQSVESERTGLKGTFYIDARGLSGREGYGRYDRDLTDLAHVVRTQTSMPVVMDRREEVFGPGSCPNTALYCGWYSVGAYVDAFDFVPGAVGVHLASFELVSLRDPGKPYWCKELLKDGAAATFGATAEPYLESFPLPTRFFGALLTGRYTLVEAFYRSLPFNSWQLSLLGDPLYNPFKNNPQLPADWEDQP